MAATRLFTIATSGIRKLSWFPELAIDKQSLVVILLVEKKKAERGINQPSYLLCELKLKRFKFLIKFLTHLAVNSSE